MTIISVHVPRTGGTTFLEYLRSEFRGRLLEDYSEPWSQVIACTSELTNLMCVHGHFFARKYAAVEGAQFGIWLREPLDRLRSHYDFWREGHFPSNELWAKMTSEGWSFERFALCREGSIRNIQSQMLDVLQIDQMDFVGLTEEYDRSVTLFSRIFGLPEPSARLRRNQAMTRSSENLSSASLRAIRRLHAEDFEVYDQAKSRFSELTGLYNVPPPSQL